MNHAVRTCLVFLLCWSPSPGWCDSTAVELAKAHWNLGQKLYRTSNYPSALAEFKKAYKLAPKPIMLMNMARCHEAMGQFFEAVDRYRAYLKADPSSQHAELVRLKIPNLEKQLAAKKPTRSKEPLRSLTPSAASRPARQSGVHPVGDKAAVHPGSRPSSLQPVSIYKEKSGAPDGKTVDWRKAAGWIALGVGTASIVAGSVLGGLVSTQQGDYEQGVREKKTHDELAAIHDQGEVLEKAHLATLITGGVLAAAGGGLLLWAHLRGEGSAEQPARLGLAPFSDGYGLGIMATGLWE